MKKIKWVLKKGFAILPERRPVKPIGRITLLGKELTLEQSSNYIKSLWGKIKLEEDFVNQ